MANHGEQAVSLALEDMAITLGKSSAVPTRDVVRALERAAERLRVRSAIGGSPADLVTQAEAARLLGVSRQAVNLWARKGSVRGFDGDEHRYAPKVALSEVAVIAHRHTRPTPFTRRRRSQLLRFLAALGSGSTAGVAARLGEAVDGGAVPDPGAEPTRVLREFVLASTGSDGAQQEFTPAGARQLARLTPRFVVDPGSPFGRLAGSLDLVVTSVDGVVGFDAPVTAVLGLLGAGTIGSCYPGTDADEGRRIAAAAGQVWGADWPARLLDVALYLGEELPVPLTRYTASLTYLDNNRFLRQAQPDGVSVAYSRTPGPYLPQMHLGAPALDDLLAGRPALGPWRFSADAAGVGRPVDLGSGVSPFRHATFEHGLLDASIHGIRRYCVSREHAGRELQRRLGLLSRSERRTYLDHAVGTLARTLSAPQVELCAVDAAEDFDWWKDHIIRASPREILLGLRDDEARRVAHALLVRTDLLPSVVESADGPLRERLRIYVKNLEFDVVDARYQDDLRRGTTRVLSRGGCAMTEAESLVLARAEIESLTERTP